MLADVSRYWWLIALRGVFAVLFGLAAFTLPGPSLLALVLLFGAYALVDGVASIVAAIRAGRHHGQWWAMLIEGIVGVAAGLITFVWPAITALALLYLIAAWALMTGVLEIVAAVRLRQVISNEWLLGLSGVISIAYGVLLIIM